MKVYLRRHGGVMKKLLIGVLLWAVVLGVAAAQQAQPLPLSKAEVLDLVKSSVPSKVVTEAMGQSGIAFKATEEVLDEFRKAGASDALLAALREAGAPESTKPLGDKDILILLAEDVPSETIVKSVEQRGMDFQPSEDRLAKLQSQGAKDALIDVLRSTTPRPFSKDELAQSLAARQDPGQMMQKVQERGIDFEPSEENLNALRTAGASETLLQAVRDAKRVKPFVAQPPGPPGVKLSSPTATSTHGEGKEATVMCPHSEPSVPVFSDPADTIVAHLQCGDRVILGQRDFRPFGMDQIQYGDGKVGYVWDYYLGGTAPIDPMEAGVTPPRPTCKPEPSYTREARHNEVQGIVTLWIVVDARGNVAEVRELSGRLGDGLDEQAIETVKTWKFRPAMRDGVPVPVRVMVEISFRLKYGTP
jgi:TonB family protein